MKLAIVGSRDYPDLNAVRGYVRELPADTLVISGGARGVDRTAASEAYLCGLQRLIHLPDRDLYPDIREALFQRNELIARDCDQMVAFWDGQSRGTAHAIGCAHKLGRPVTVIRPGTPLPA